MSTSYIVETSFLVKESSQQKEAKKGEKYYTALIEAYTKDWDFGVITEDVKASSSKDLTPYKGKKVKVKAEIYKAKTGELGIRILEVLV